MVLGGIEKIVSYEDYSKNYEERQFEYVRRRQYEQSLISAADRFLVPGFCYVCRQETNFLVDYEFSYKIYDVAMPNWRERLLCSGCGMINRYRATIHLIEQILNPQPQTKIYIAEQLTAVYKWLTAHYSNVVSSEFLGNELPFGETTAQGLRNEDFTKLSFENEQFDIVLSFDIFEHVPNFLKAFRESYRVLKQSAAQSGSLFFTVPFKFDSSTNIVRAIEKEDGKILHRVPPEYHGRQRWLAFHQFGWELLDQVRAVGFEDVGAYLYWSKEFGYLGREQAVFIARKGPLSDQR